MQRWKNSLFNIVLCFNCLLLLFVLAGDKLHVPAWLQVVGRMHPLLLHFPIVLLIMYIVWSIFLQAKSGAAFNGPEDEIGKWLLLAASFTAALTALMGFLLSKEEGYHSQALWWHKWGGVSVSVFSFLWYAYKNTIHRRRYMPQAAALIIFILIVFTGHQGANITHGENYLLAPITPDKTRPSIAIEQAVVYRDMIRPILEAKCMSCHNSQKAKGELVMETEPLLLKGGKHGTIWVTGQPAQSLLIERIHLPETEKKHMPPAGKPQLDDEESAILFQWIKSGAPFKEKITDLAATDSLRLLANNFFNKPTEEIYDFSAASDKDIEKLNNTNRLIHPIAQGSPALAVNFYNLQNYTTASLKDLLSLKTQIVSLDMAYMPVKEEDLGIIAQFTSLRKLNLNFSTVPGKSLAGLKQLHYLAHLSLSGTTVKQQDIAPLVNFPGLQTVFLWNAPISATEMAGIRKKNTDIHFETGFSNDTVQLKLNAPVLETEARIINGAPIPVQLRHYIKGVTIRYTTDGSTPDSLNAPIYKKDLVLDKAVVLKARAFKPGWLGSDSVMATFYKNGFRADSIRSLTALDSFFKGGSTGAKTLIDAVKGDLSRNNKWLGFRRNKMEMLLQYAAPVTISSVVFSTQVDIGGYVMPPALLEVWGGTSEKNMQRLARLVPQQPDSTGPAYLHGYDCNFKPASIRFLKVIAVPVAKLPPWHPAKGQPGWVFVDELFVN